MQFQDRIKAARLAKGYTQEHLAKMIGVAKSTLTGYEKGNREPDVLKIKRLAEVLDTTGDYLICITDNPAKPIVRGWDSVSPEAQEIAILFDKADERDKETVRHVLGRYKGVEVAEELRPDIKGKAM